MSESTEGAASLPTPRDFAHALALLTRLPLPAPALGGWQFAQASLFFPIIGVAVGIALVWTAHVVGQQVDPTITAICVAILWEILGVPLTAPSESGPRRAAAKVAPAIALLAALVTKIMLLASLGTLLNSALLFAPVLGRWSFVVLAVGSRNADHHGRKFSTAVTFREFGVASLIAFVLVFTLGQFIGLILIVVSAATTLLLRLAFHRWQGGVTWGTIVGGMQVVEIVAVAALASLPE